MSLSLSTLGRFALVLAPAALAAACMVDSSPQPQTTSWAGPSVELDAGVSSASSEDGGPSAHPILALVDTNQTMNAAPGAGLGVFVEYDSGGNWNVWWSCGPEQDGTDPPCQFDVKVSVASGSISGPATRGFLATDTFTASGSQIEGVTTTTTAFDGVTFQTAPGAVITLSATVGGVYGPFIFFVEQGKVDDGASGLVTDPVQLQGTNP
jgi:hypothetical protein